MQTSEAQNLLLFNQISNCKKLTFVVFCFISKQLTNFNRHSYLQLFYQNLLTLMLNKLDTEFQEYIHEIDKAKTQLNKHLKIRVDQWIKKLKEKVSLDVWKKNRNSYALLLKQCLENNKMVSPFNKMPAEGSLPHLKQHEINQQLNIIKKEKFTNISQTRFIKQARQRSEGRQKHSLEPKDEYEKFLKQKKPIDTFNYYSQKQKMTKQTSLSGSHLNQRNKQRNLYQRVIQFMTKYEKHYKQDPQYQSLKNELGRQSRKDGMQTPLCRNTNRYQDTELKITNPMQDEYDRGYFTSSIFQ